MIRITINFYKTKELFEQDEDLYNKLFDTPKDKFIEKQEIKWILDKSGKYINNGYEQFVFYINDFKSIDPRLFKYCLFEPVETLEMMGGAKINTENIFEAAKRNQIMLPNNMMLEMQKLHVEINACTYEINELIKNGWKLIAILPQHNQERPDYILGKLPDYILGKH